MNLSTFILIATHKDYEYPNDPGYRPIQVGRATSKSKLFIEGDDTGENISELNQNFCEITGLYWMWRNVSADVYGLSHYRRYFSPFSTSVNVKGNKIASTQSLADILKSHDILLSNPRNYWIESIQKHYKNAHNERDLEVIESIIESDHKEYLIHYKNIMRGTKLSLYNMFAMKHDHFDRYCTWLFDILFKAKEKIPYETYGPYQGRVFGFLAERLLNVWVAHNIPAQRILYLQVTNIEGESLSTKAIGLLQRKFQGKKQE